MDKEIVLFDTDALVEYFRSNNEIIQVVSEFSFENIFLTSVNKAEILNKAIDKRDFNKLMKGFDNFTIIPLDTAISERFEALTEKYTLSHRPYVPDLLIAAACEVYNLPLFTLNQKDFRFISEIRLIKHSIKPLPRKPGSWFK